MVNLKNLLQVASFAHFLCSSIAHTTKDVQTRPNIVLIMTDDQDVRLNSLDYQPAVRTYFTENGTSFVKHYCTIAQCCPSRVSLLTGKAAHNTNVTDIVSPYGGYGKFVSQGLNGQWLPSWLQEAGYTTYYTGKLMNNHSVSNYNNPYPAGFNATDFLVDPGTYLYYNATMQSNQNAPRSIPGEYSTDLVAQRALEFLQQGKQAGQPFFLTVAPIGPHGQTLFPFTAQNPSNFPIFDPPVPADRHKEKFAGIGIPRQPSFNQMIAASNGSVAAPSYLDSILQWNQTVIDYYDEYYRLRLASLAAVDDLVASIMDTAVKLDLLNNTYFIYTSDNGYHIGQHRLPAGKSCGYEEDINVPFIIRGPGITKNSVYDAPTSHTDIAPTIFSLAKIPLRDDFDGQIMPVLSSENGQGYTFSASSKQEHVNVEFWGSQSPEGKYGRDLINTVPSSNNTYKAVRLVSDQFNYYYAVWCTGERELYDLKKDKWQMTNLAFANLTEAPSSPEIDTWKVQQRLDTLLMVLKTCKGDTCRHPWKTMHPDGSVQSLVDAMKAQYDNCYLQQERVRFSRCAPGYLKELEGPDETSIKNC